MKAVTYSGHARHEGGQQRGERETKQARRAIFFQQREDDAVVVDFGDGILEARRYVGIAERTGVFVNCIFLASRFFPTILLMAAGSLCAFTASTPSCISEEESLHGWEPVSILAGRCESDRNHSGQNHQRGKQQFRQRCNNGCAARGGHVLRGHGALDDEEFVHQ